MSTKKAYKYKKLILVICIVVLLPITTFCAYFITGAVYTFNHTPEKAIGGIVIKDVYGEKPEYLSKKYVAVAEIKDDDGRIIQQYYQRTPMSMYGGIWGILPIFDFQKLFSREDSGEVEDFEVCCVTFEDNKAVRVERLPISSICNDLFERCLIYNENTVEYNSDNTISKQIVQTIKNGDSINDVINILGKANGGYDFEENDLLNVLTYCLEDGTYAHICFKTSTKDGNTSVYVDKIVYNSDIILNKWDYAYDEIFNPF